MSDYITVDEKLIDKLDEVKIDNGKCIMLYAKILAMASNKGYTTAGNKHMSVFMTFGLLIYCSYFLLNKKVRNNRYEILYSRRLTTDFTDRTQTGKSINEG